MDDAESVVRVASAMLKHMGYSAAAAKEGEAAISLYQKELAQDKPFSVVILDLAIPGGMGGREAIAKSCTIQRLSEVLCEVLQGSAP